MKYLTNIDLTKQQLMNAAIHNLASAPASPVAGQIYFNTVDHKYYGYNGTDWIDLSAQMTESSGTVQMTGSEIVAAINGSASIIDADNVASGIATTWANVASKPSSVVADIDDAVSKRHSQNTDSGTSSDTFTLGTGGIKVKNSAGELQVRNNADNDYADIRVKNLTVEGTTTTVNSETIELADNEIVLNSNITAAGQNSDGGITIKRFDGNGQRQDAQLYYSNSDGFWYIEEPVLASSGTVGSQIPRKTSLVVGNGSDTTFVVDHWFNSRELVVSVFETNSPYAQVYTDVELTTQNSITVKFALAPTSGQYIVTIIG